jgi:hypothetical protein
MVRSASPSMAMSAVAVSRLQLTRTAPGRRSYRFARASSWNWRTCSSVSANRRVR